MIIIHMLDVVQKYYIFIFLNGHIRQCNKQNFSIAVKRDVRVRALEVAEAAKRREEKKQTEREKRKTAVELERERLKQEKEHRQKQVEQQKKMDADIISRKRQRENHGKRGNETKRNCVEGAPKHQKQLVEKMHSTNAVKDACPNNTVSKHYNYHYRFKLLYEIPFLVSLIISGCQGSGGEFSERAEESIIIR